jgi:uncharacterized membrane protein
MDLISLILGIFIGFIVGLFWKYIRQAIDNDRKDQEVERQRRIEQVRKEVYQIE